MRSRWIFCNCCCAVLAVVCVVAFIMLASGWRFCIVQSSSMAPCLNVGDVVAYRASELCAGDVVVFESEGKLVAHRIQNIDPTYILVSGDSEYAVAQKIFSQNIVGKVVYYCSFDKLFLGIFLTAICIGTLVVICVKIKHFWSKNAKKSHF